MGDREMPRFAVGEALREREQVLQDVTNGLFVGQFALCPLLQ